MLVSDMDEIACDALKSWLWSSVALVSSLDVRMISYDSLTRWVGIGATYCCKSRSMFSR